MNFDCHLKRNMSNNKLIICIKYGKHPIKYTFYFHKKTRYQL